MADDRTGRISGLTEQEAQEFHGDLHDELHLFMAIAIVAHFLVWMWRPWLPGADGYATCDRWHASTAASVSLLVLT